MLHAPLLLLESNHVIHSVRWTGAGAGGWSGMKEKYCWLAGGWKLVLERCEKKTLLGWRLLELPNRVIEIVMFMKKCSQRYTSSQITTESTCPVT